MKSALRTVLIVGLLVAAAVAATHLVGMDPLSAKAAGLDLVGAMAVFTRYGDAVKDPTSIRPADSVNAEGLDRTAYSKIAVANDDSTSTWLLARLPSNAKLRPNSTLYYSALTGLTSLSVGLGKDGAIVNAKTAALVSAEDVHLAGSVLLSKAIAAGSLGKRLWELAGYSADPGGMIDIIATTGANCSTTGTVEAFIGFFKG